VSGGSEEKRKQFVVLNPGERTGNPQNVGNGKVHLKKQCRSMVKQGSCRKKIVAGNVMEDKNAMGPSPKGHLGEKW